MKPFASVLKIDFCTLNPHLDIIEYSNRKSNNDIFPAHSGQQDLEIRFSPCPCWQEASLNYTINKVL